MTDPTAFIGDGRLFDPAIATMHRSVGWPRTLK